MGGGDSQLITIESSVELNLKNYYHFANTTTELSEALKSTVVVVNLVWRNTRNSQMKNREKISTEKSVTNTNNLRVNTRLFRVDSLMNKTVFVITEDAYQLISRVASHVHNDRSNVNLN